LSFLTLGKCKLFGWFASIKVHFAHPYFDCSPAGFEAFFEGNMMLLLFASFLVDSTGYIDSNAIIITQDFRPSSLWLY
jgi:hypothetical protein